MRAAAGTHQTHTPADLQRRGALAYAPLPSSECARIADLPWVSDADVVDTVGLLVVASSGVAQQLGRVCEVDGHVQVVIVGGVQAERHVSEWPLHPVMCARARLELEADFAIREAEEEPGWPVLDQEGAKRVDGLMRQLVRSPPLPLHAHQCLVRLHVHPNATLTHDISKGDAISEDGSGAFGGLAAVYLHCDATLPIQFLHRPTRRIFAVEADRRSPVARGGLVDQAGVFFAFHDEVPQRLTGVPHKHRARRLFHTLSSRLRAVALVVIWPYPHTVDVAGLQLRLLGGGRHGHG
mmetsp:Transcript_17633/g.42395  ORF Transcript_17633/g.42395 Transcript_17633/m.42395 type:complete len:295 (-) Transcript_17633:148-1032(-)